VVAALGAAIALSGCSSDPPTAHGVLDALEDAGVATCTARREPVAEVLTCEDAGGDLTVGVVEDPVGRVRATAEGVEGPWVVGDGVVVITYDGDRDRARAIADVLGGGDLYDVDEDGEPVRID
jgi:hypothetical protein